MAAQDQPQDQPDVHPEGDTPVEEQSTTPEATSADSAGTDAEAEANADTDAEADAEADAAPAEPEIPAEVHKDYENTAAREALTAFHATPDYVHLAALLNSFREGYLVADVSGTGGKRRGPRVRTIRSTRGQLVLPLFTSLAELRALTPEHKRSEVKGAVLPARDALGLIHSDRFVAAEFDKSSASLVLLRKYITLAHSDEEITAESLEAMK